MAHIFTQEDRRKGGKVSGKKRSKKYEDDFKNLSWDILLEKYNIFYNIKWRFKERILKEQNFLCGICGMKPLWNGKPLNFEMHHKDGNRKNNKRENLTMVCPNCHTQTENHSKAKNVKNQYSGL